MNCHNTITTTLIQCSVMNKGYAILIFHPNIIRTVMRNLIMIIDTCHSKHPFKFNINAMLLM